MMVQQLYPQSSVTSDANNNNSNSNNQAADTESLTRDSSQITLDIKDLSSNVIYHDNLTPPSSSSASSFAQQQTSHL
jgi:hypothetical protein